MSKKPITVVSWPRAILHVDGDSFFASVEQALDPQLRQRPVVTGAERGIATAISKEAKLLGITRGMPVQLIKRTYPECVVVHGNYEAYLVFAKRMFDIMRRFTPMVEEYSIDEAFADITGLRRLHKKNYEEIARAMQNAIERELDLTVSVGVSLTKTLAKLCSKFRKPHGVTCVKGRYIHLLLERMPVGRVWGIGPNIAALLQKFGCQTAYDFVIKPASFVQSHLTKKEMEIYKELRGELVYPIDNNKKETYKSLSKAKTFEPTMDPVLLLAQMVKNVEEAAAKCRRYGLVAQGIIVMLKTQQFETEGTRATLNRATASTIELVDVVKMLFFTVYRKAVLYRSTMVILSDIMSNQSVQLNLFESVLRIRKLEKVSAVMDQINRSHGRKAVYLALSLPVRVKMAAAKPQIAIPMAQIRV